MVNKNFVIENKKPVETVAELKNEHEIPTFEEFMKNYEGSVNYADLNNSDIGTQKGYGPCSSRSCRYPSVSFKIEIRLDGYHLTRSKNSFWWFHEGVSAFGFYNIDDARDLLDELEERDMILVNSFWNVESDSARSEKNHLKRVLRRAIRDHEAGAKVDINERTMS